MTKWIGWSKSKIRYCLLTVFGINPYTDGTMGSLRWKRRRGKALSEAEEKISVEWSSLTAPANQWLTVLKTMEPSTHYFDVVFVLLDNLPQSIKDDLYDTPFSEVDAKIERLLPVANALRQQRSVVLANRAVLLGIVAVLVGVISVAASIFLTITNC